MAEPDKKKLLEDNKTDFPSNEDVVQSIIKDVEGTCLKDEIKQDEPTLLQSSSGVSEDHSGIDSESIISENEKYSDVNGEVEQEKKDENPKENDEDFIDEEHLKDVELEYTEEDKTRLKEEAEKLKNEGNVHFKGGEYKEAALSYTQALRICPLAFIKNRAVLYSNRGAAKVKLSLNLSAIEDCTKAVELDPQYLKAYVRRAQLYEDTDKLDEALEDYKKILEIDPLHRDALYASKRLAEQINERNEKMKTEMLGKLKDLGNMFLKPFGLSTNNFQMVQDPNSGGYSINFSQNPNHS